MSDPRLQCDTCRRDLDVIQNLCCLSSCVHFVDKEFSKSASPVPCECTKFSVVVPNPLAQLQTRRQNACPHIRATATLPDVLNLAVDYTSERTVISRLGIPIRSIFGPLVAPRSRIKLPNVPKFCRSGPTAQSFNRAASNLDLDDECNWMKHVRHSPSDDQQNLTAFEIDGDVYFVTTRDIPIGEELRYGHSRVAGINSDDTAYIEIDELVPHLTKRKNSAQKQRLENERPRKKTAAEQKKAGITYDVTFKVDSKVVTFKAADRSRIKAPTPADKRRAAGKNICVICGKSCQNRKVLRQHKELKHLDMYQCFVCKGDLSALNKAGIEEHLQTHRVDGVFPCDICKKTWDHHAGLRSHVKVVHGDSKYPCDVCGKTAATKAQADVHMRSHQTTRIECAVCGQKFKNAQRCNWHTNFKHTEAEVAAAKRGEKVPQPTKRISRTAAADNYEQCLYKCRECKLGFGLQKSLVAHMQARHPDTPLQSIQELNLPQSTCTAYQCLLCTISTLDCLSPEQMIGHLKRRHQDTQKDMDEETWLGKCSRRFEATVNPCEVCKGVYRGGKVFLRHVYAIHPEYFHVLMPLGVEWTIS